MSGYYDDNFGHWDSMDGQDGEDNREFYRQVQSTNVRKKCAGCRRMVSIQPHYALCNSCADKAERGGEFMCDDDDDDDDGPDNERDYVECETGGEDAHLDASYEERTHIELDWGPDDPDPDHNFDCMEDER